MRKRHAGYIAIDSKFFGRLLDFEGAILWSAKVDDFGVVRILVEHPDLPLVKEGESIKDIYVTHTVTFADNGVITKLERTDPPKLATLDKKKA